MYWTEMNKGVILGIREPLQRFMFSVFLIHAVSFKKARNSPRSSWETRFSRSCQRRYSQMRARINPNAETAIPIKAKKPAFIHIIIGSV
ncbi:hypothetical protein BJP41_10070 (plasmid) [Candidatus Williamhamiltonella defendens]|uniref:Uncharacterized protein n=1 Tax=Candidatus Williamhamiltonella defendens TaxID=138072 RepID=A0A2D3T4U1_9ENTR|nr:hypothetical protein BJP41_10070 [Candidatus Hamiltonella defensa]